MGKGSNVAKSAEARKRNEAKKEAEGKGGGGAAGQLARSGAGYSDGKAAADAARAERDAKRAEKDAKAEVEAKRAAKAKKDAANAVGGGGAADRAPLSPSLARAGRARESDGAAPGALPTRERQTTCSQPASRARRRSRRRVRFARCGLCNSCLLVRGLRHANAR